MPKINIRFLFLSLIILAPVLLHATHNRAGEISISPIGECTDFSVQAIITTYTKASSVAADRDSLEICWGDGTCEMIIRSNGPNNNGQPVGNDTKKNLYIATHTYTASGTYTISMTDPNRNGGILNVNDPNSDTVPFHLQTTYSFLNCQFDGPNSTPQLLQPPIDVGCIGQPFIHNPNPIDPDGDSLSFKMVTPLQSIHTPVPNYLYPNFIQPGPENNYTLDPITGDFLWTSPQQVGEYNIAMIIISWRDGEPIDTTLRDMQILIEDCNDNLPPVIEADDYICVVAGETLNLEILADDPNPGDKILLTALGGPLQDDFFSNATFTAPNNFSSPVVVGNFVWETQCEHISDQPYFIVFKAIDDAGNPGLADLKTLRIKVVGPAPENVQAESVNNTIEVTWDRPYYCEDANDNYFYGFSVWRKIGSNQFPIDTCETGLEGKGYTRVIGITTEVLNDGKYIYIDEDVDQGKTYCYRVLANFAKLTNTNFPQPYNRVESLTSEESCVQLNRDVPLMVNVDVESTSTANGEIFVRWTRPVAEDLDTLLNPGPYTFELFMAEGISGTDYVPTGFSSTADTYWEAVDTFTTVTDLNTQDLAYRFKVDFFVDGDSEVFGSSNQASSIYLSISPSDEQNTLSWDFDVPWDNVLYTIYREDNNGDFVFLGTSTETSYVDENLVNGREYCYYIEAEGDYGIQDLNNSLINKSQEACGTPIDLIPPCPPLLEVSNICDDAINCVEIDLINELLWRNPNSLCVETDDVIAYNIYFKNNVNSDYELIETIGDPNDTLYFHSPEFGLAGCYALTAVDSFQNESAFSNEICVDNCPRYELPNTFTPNGNGQNDVFIPYPFCFIDHIELKIFNRWGEIVFESMDPNINWDGKNKNGQDLPPGTYYYICKVFEDRVNGIIERSEPLSGYIDLYR